ncbi:MAG: hypothetical protein WA978_08075 [Sphingopyxis granuli]|uniref:hypothetical protein n=1 Tax=Sphingopyxis granuli TaxID=267128 RepID=UPI003C74DB5F
MSDRPANGVRTLSYRAALREALIEEMQRDERVFMMGPDPKTRGDSDFGTVSLFRHPDLVWQ